MAARFNRTLQAVLALLLVTSLLSFVPSASAAASDVQGGWVFNGGPQKGVVVNKTTLVGPAQKDTVRTVHLAMPTGTMVTVNFEVARQSGGAYLEFQGYQASQAVGFTGADAYPSTSAGIPDRLQFTGGSIVGTNGADFRLTFSVKGNPAPGSTFTVDVTVYEGDGITSHKLSTGSLVIKVDNVAPTLKEAVAYDTNLDGHLDQLTLEFSESMEWGRFRLDQFNFTLTPAAGQTRIYQPLPGLTTWDKEYRKVTIGLSALAYFDTGDMPDIAYQASDADSVFTDLAGNSLPLDASLAFKLDHSKVVDKARPVLVSALGYVNGIELLLTFSEPVYGTGDVPGGTCVPGSKDQVVLCDLVYIDGGDVDGLVNNIQQLSDLKPPTSPPGSTTIKVPLASPGGVQKKFGSQDVSFTQGDFVQAAIRPGGGVCNDSPAPCTRIHDKIGNTVVQAGPFLKVKVSSPQAIEAEVNIDSFKLTLKFNGPVSSTAGDGIGIEARALDVVTTTGGKPGGIDRIEHVPGTSIAILTLDQRVAATDVDTTPSSIRINCDPAKPGGVSFIKATGLLGDITVPCGLIPMVDRTRPAILKAGTVDRDHNGFIDGFALEFNEPVSDASFCMGAKVCPSLYATCNNPGPGQCSERTAPIPCTYDSTRGCSLMALNISGLDPSTPFSFETGDRIDDRFGLLTWPESFVVPPTASQPNPVNPHNNRRFTDFVPNLRTVAFPNGLLNDTRIGLFTDLVSNGTTVNVMLNITTELVVESDTAPPVVMKAETVDSTILAGDFAEGNGYLDSYKVTYSEAVRDTTFSKSEWTVEGHRVTGMTTGFQTAKAPISTFINDDIQYVEFDEGTQPDTDAKPQLVYTLGQGGGTASGLKDLNGNALLSFRERDVNETDRARPVIVSVTGFVGQDVLLVNVSEPIDDGRGGGVIWDDFFYANVYRVPDSSDASGRSQTALASHTPNTKTVKLPLNRPLLAGDIGMDTLNAAFNLTRETAPSLPAGQRQSISTVRHPVTAGVDVTPPAAVTNFGVDATATNANSIQLHWTAPGDDGTAHGPVADYTVRVSKVEFNATTFAGVTSPPGLSFTYIADRSGTLGLAAPGLLQTVIVTGLDPKTTYYFGVQACDERLGTVPAVVPPGEGCLGHRNVGPAVGGSQSDTTRQDFTPPTGDLTVSSITHRKNTPTPASLATFNWTAMSDPESTVVYYTALTKDPNYEPSLVKDAQNATTSRSASYPSGAGKRLPDGTYTFSVRAKSACDTTCWSKTARYTIIVGYPTIRSADIEEASKAIGVVAVRQQGINTVNWTLPAKADLPPQAVLEGLEIYRLDDGKVTRVKQFSGNYEQLQNGQWQDTSAGASASSAYRVDMVFAHGQTQTNPTASLEGFQATRVLDRSGLPTLALVGIGILIALAVAGIVVAIVMARRKAKGVPAAAGGAGFAYQDLAPPSAVDPTTGLPIHDVRCPSCSTEFQAQGQMPLQIACPNCGVAGVLQ